MALYKIVNYQQAVDFSLGAFLNELQKYANTTIQLEIANVSVNFSNHNFNSFNSFEKYLKAGNEICNAFVEYVHSGDNCTVETNNYILNYISDEYRPTHLPLSIEISIDEKLISLNDATVLADNLVQKYSFEYGYVHTLSSDKYFGETKIKKGLFSLSTMENENSLIWNQQLHDIHRGFIKQLYYVNYLNQSQAKNNSIRACMESFGIYSRINDRITKWILDKGNYESLRRNKDIINASIVKKT